MNRTHQTFTDQRVRLAAEHLAQKGTKLLSLDIFDTLIGRRVPRAPDVFLFLGRRLEQQGLLLNGQKPDSFAAIRYQTEYARRAIRQKEFGDREITLEEIYATFPKNILRDDITVAQLVEMEIACECDLCFINDDILALARLARDNGVKVAFITNSYFSESGLTKILSRCAPDMPKPDAFFVSSQHRMGKRTGLLRALVDHFALKPDEVLHIGDNPVADKLAAEEAGIAFIDLGADDDGFEPLLTDEQPRQWWERTQQFGHENGDYGLSWLRRQAGAWPIPEECGAARHDIYRYGTRHIGPLLTGFTGWAADRLKQEKAPAVFGLLREGDFLTQLLAKHAPMASCRKLAVSRLSTALCCFTPERPDYLEDFLTRRGFWSIGMLMAQLGFTHEQARLIDDPTLTLEHVPAHELTQRLVASPLADELFERSRARRSRLLVHLRGLGALDHERLYLLDLGYAATIQRGLQRIFALENIATVTHGLYLVTAHVSLGTQLAGGIVEGFLAQNGNPNDFACAFCRSPEVVEAACMPPYGTVVDYAQDGSPLFSDDVMPVRQIEDVAVIQKATLDFADRFISLIAKGSAKPDFLHEGWRAQMRGLALRIVAHPTAHEAHLVGHWMADSDMGLSSPRPIVSAGPHQDLLATLSAPQLAALPRRDLPWLFGVAATLSYAHCRQVARLILQHEKPEAFKNPHVSTHKDGA